MYNVKILLFFLRYANEIGSNSTRWYTSRQEAKRTRICKKASKSSMVYKKKSVYVNGELSNIKITTKIVNWKRYITGVNINGQDVRGLDILRYEE